MQKIKDLSLDGYDVFGERHLGGSSFFEHAPEKTFYHNAVLFKLRSPRKEAHRVSEKFAF